MISNDKLFFDKWLNSLIIDTKTLSQKLASLNLTVANAEQKMVEAIVKFEFALEKYEINTKNKVLICYELQEKMNKKDDKELFGLFLQLVCDKGLLQPKIREKRTPEENLSTFLDLVADTNYLQKLFAERIAYRKKWEKIKKNINWNKNNSDCKENTIDSVEIVAIYHQTFPRDKTNSIFRENITNICEFIDSVPELRTIAPLFLYQVITLHKQRLFSVEGLYFDINKLWKYRQYKIDVDNGKNYSALQERVDFFLTLCKLFSKYKATDIKFSQYIFLLLSNISEWYDSTANHNNDYLRPIESIITSKNLVYVDTTLVMPSLTKKSSKEDFLDDFYQWLEKSAVAKKFASIIAEHLLEQEEIIIEYLQTTNFNESEHVIKKILSICDPNKNFARSINSQLFPCLLSTIIAEVISIYCDKLLINIAKKICD